MLATWRGKPILPTRASQDEMFDHDIFLDDVADILEEGFDCSRSKRKKNMYERCIQRGKTIIKVVVADTGEHLVLTHVGTFTASKRKLQQLKGGRK